MQPECSVKKIDILGPALSYVNEGNAKVVIFSTSLFLARKGNDLVNYVQKPRFTIMQLAGCCNHISSNTFLTYLLQSKHAP